MCNVGITIENFNPEILYAFKYDNKDFLDGEYHCHDFIEFTYVVSGSVNYRIEDKFYKIEEKTLLPFNPGVYHKESLHSGEQATELHIGFRNIKVEGLPLNHILRENLEIPLEFKQYKEDFHKCCLEIIKNKKPVRLEKN